MSERIACLKHAFEQGFETSVSMEPMLDGVRDAERTFYRLVPLVSDKVWIGRMNQVRRRVCPRDPEVLAACERIERLQSDVEILKLVTASRGHPKIAWKDSISKVLM